MEAASAAFGASENARKAFVEAAFDEAREAARRLDAAPPSVPPPPLLGMPVAVKDIFDMAGCVTRCGRHRSLQLPRAEADAEAVRLLRQAGAVVVGRTHQTELAFSATGYNPHYPQPFSPFGNGRMPGGSSSGSALAVAEGAAVAALGTDTGGSIRVPAAWCGVVGYKPTSGLISLKGVAPLAPSLDTCGFFANTVADCALLTSVCAPQLDAEGAPKPTPRDVWKAHVGGDNWPLPQPARLRVARLEGALTSDMDAPTSESYRGAIVALSAEGMRIERVELPFFTELMEAMRIIFYVEGAHSNLAIAKDPEKLAAVDETVRLRIVDGCAVPATDYVTALQTRARLQAEMEKVMVGFDVAVLPTVPVAPPEVSECVSDAKAMADAARNSSRNTRLCNILDRPAITIPCHLNGSDLPAGLTVMGNHGRDGELLAAAAVVERVLRAAGRGER